MDGWRWEQYRWQREEVGRCTPTPFLLRRFNNSICIFLYSVFPLSSLSKKNSPEREYSSSGSRRAEGKRKPESLRVRFCLRRTHMHTHSDLYTHRALTPRGSASRGVRRTDDQSLVFVRTPKDKK
ncbi:hypothetical protein CHARACLAT_001175 [Characodon lateralis]|uniref:Uncharacterized protein n=1 Tax=Characodon lateralis TaxID=208331 RepID=A0ABU7DCL3_9TELE|nr:hypothetical protein [Characodon lateralis]